MTDDEAGGCYHLGRFFRGECPVRETGRQSLYNMIKLCALRAHIHVVPGD